MGQLKQKEDQANVNVTLGGTSSETGDFSGREFPCPLCGAGRPIKASKRKKPYLVCDFCGVQLFVRGKAGISRLREMATLGILVSNSEESAMHGINLFNRLEQLKLQKRDLTQKRGIFFYNSDAENALRIVDAEIEKVQGELAKIAMKTESDKNK